MIKSIATCLSLGLSLLAGAAAAAEEVNVYSHRQPSLVQPLFDAFTKETGITVNVQFLNKGLVERLLAEGEFSPADIAMTVDIARLMELVDADVTEALKDPIIEGNIPSEYRDPTGHWFGLTARARIIYASKDRVKTFDVSTYEDLADPKWSGRICTRSGKHPYNLALTSAVIAHHGLEDAKAWLAGVKGNLARKPSGNDRAQVKAIWAGECDISIGNTYYMAKMLADPEQQAWAASVRIMFPKFEDGGTHVNLSGMALIKGAPNKENALRLMQFLSSGSAQQIYAKENGEYPLKPGVAASDLVKSWGELKADETSLSEIGKLRPSALELVQEIDFDG